MFSCKCDRYCDYRERSLFKLRAKSVYTFEMFPSVLKVRSTQQLQRVQTNTHTHMHGHICTHSTVTNSPKLRLITLKLTEKTQKALLSMQYWAQKEWFIRFPYLGTKIVMSVRLNKWLRTFFTIFNWQLAQLRSYTNNIHIYFLAHYIVFILWPWLLLLLSLSYVRKVPAPAAPTPQKKLVACSISQPACQRTIFTLRSTASPSLWHQNLPGLCLFYILFVNFV